MKYVGKKVPIEDAGAKATGKIKYLTDRTMGPFCYVELITSPIPHGRITNIVTGPAEKDDVIKTYAYFNTPKIHFNTQKWFVGQKGAEDQVLFPETARYVGEPVAAIVAADKRAAKQAAAKVDVTYEALPHVIDPEDAIKKSFQIHPDIHLDPVNFYCGSEDSLERSFSEAAAVIEDRVVTPKVHPGAMENHAFMAHPNPNGGVTVYSPCQIIFSVRMIVAQVTGLPFHKVRVIKTPVGGSFGGKQEITYEPHVAFMALDLDRPVMLELSRKQAILSTRTRTKTIGTVKTAVDKQGRIKARDVSLVVDAGAYTSNGRVISMAMGKKLFRLYRIPEQKFHADITHTNTPVSGAVRGYGSPQIHAATEINLDHAARLLNLDPVAFRLKNLVHPHDPDPSGGPPLGNARIRDCVLKGAAEFDWEMRREKTGGSGRWRTGVGMACATHVNGYYGAYQDFSTMTLRLLEDGTLILNACLHELGHGVVTIVKQIVAEVMSHDPDQIEVPETDSDTSPYDIGCQASRGTYVIGGCAKKVAERLKDTFAEYASQILGTTQDEIRFDGGYLWSVKNPRDRRRYGDVVALIQQKLQKELVATLTHHSPGNPGSYAADFAEVAVDTYTGLVSVTDFVAVHDVGKAINPGFVEGQIHGGIQMGIGMALSEEIDTDIETGVPKTDRYGRYHMVNAPDMPKIRIFLIENGEEGGPFGAKSVGEISTVPVAPAVVNAVNHALNTNLTTLPLTPERITAGVRRKA